jgi:hypothetical protein
MKKAAPYPPDVKLEKIKIKNMHKNQVAAISNPPPQAIVKRTYINNTLINQQAIAAMRLKESR